MNTPAQNLLTYLELHAEAAACHYDPPMITGATEGEIVAAIEVLRERLRTGAWPRYENAALLTRHYCDLCRQREDFCRRNNIAFCATPNVSGQPRLAGTTKEDRP